MSDRESLLDSFYKTVIDSPNKFAIGDDGQQFTFSELNDAVQHFSQYIKSNTRYHQSIIAFSVSSSPLACIIELAIWKEGHIAMSLPASLTLAEADGYLKAVCPELLIVEDLLKQDVWLNVASSTVKIFVANKGVIHSFPDKENTGFEYDGDALQIQFTSGSSGKPKALIFEAKAVAAGISQSLHWYEEFQKRNAFSSLPHYHAMGRSVIFECLWSGRGVSLSNTMAIGNHKKRILANDCGLILSNPTYIRLCLQVGFWKSLECIDRFVIGTSLVESDLPIKIKEQLPNVSIDIRYGVSESFGALTRLSIDPGDSRKYPAGYVGKALSGVAVDVLKDEFGSVVAKSPATASAIIENKVLRKLEDRSGYLLTGDIGRIVDTGGLVLHGRSNVFLKHRGYRIDPIEIESIILECNGVFDVIVVGEPDDNEGEKIVAVIEVEQPEEFDVSVVATYCKEKLSSYKLPSRIICVTALLRKPSGKPDREGNLNRVLSNCNSNNRKEC